MKDEEFRALQEQSHQLGELTRHPGWSVLVDYLHTFMNPDKRALLNGAVEDYDRYKSLTGKLQGIHFVIDAPAEVEKMVERESTRRSLVRPADQ